MGKLELKKLNNETLRPSGKQKKGAATAVCFADEASVSLIWPLPFPRKSPQRKELRIMSNNFLEMKRNYLIAIIAIVGVFWLQSCAEKKPEKVVKNVQYVTGANEVTYLRLGKEITDTVGATLKGNLVKAMKSGGPTNAVQFCNMEAMPLTEVYSLKYNTDVKRVSDRNRNPKNAANEKELAVLDDFKRTLASGEALSPKVAIDAEGKKHYYAPIFTGGRCLTCHGNPKNMQPELVMVIDSLYPNDKAKGYAVDELRGIWSVKFKNS